MSFTIRPETPEDRTHIATLIARTYLADGAKVIDLAGQLRELPQHESALSLVGEKADHETPVAFALFTPLKVGETEGKAVLLAPLAIDTYAPDVDYNAFLKGAMDEVAQKGYRYVLMHGDPDMYADDGFKTARSMGIESAVTYPGTELLVKDFEGDKPADIQGDVAYPPFLK